MADYFSLPQIIGYVALITYVLAYLFKKDNHLKIAFSGSNLFWIAHYYLIGAQTAAFTTALATVRNMLSLDSKDAPEGRKRIICATFWLLALIVGALTWAGPVSLIPVSASIIFSYTVFYIHGIRFRQVCFLVDAAWLLHAILVSSIGGFVYAVGSLIVNGYMLIKIMRGTPVVEDSVGPI